MGSFGTGGEESSDRIQTYGIDKDGPDQVTKADGLNERFMRMWLKSPEDKEANKDD
jgi:hypothetical protein